MAAPRPKTSTALSACIGEIFVVQEIIDGQQYGHASHEHAGGNVNATKMVGDKKRHEWR